MKVIFNTLNVICNKHLRNIVNIGRPGRLVNGSLYMPAAPGGGHRERAVELQTINGR
jgi:hypothetical protein